MEELSKKSNTKRKWTKLIFYAAYMLMCLVMGFLGGYVMGRILPKGVSVLLMGAALMLMLAGYICVLLLHIFLHETGHMLCGMISGYEFCSIRFLNVMIVKQEGKLAVRSYHLPGVAGQCLMKPPAVDGSSPFRLYHWGGCIANMTFSLLSIFVALLVRNEVISAVLFIFGTVGFGLALMNGIPLKFLSNDGYNAVTLSKRREARIAVEKSLLINEQVSENVRIKDMPEEWFTIDEKQMDLSDNMVVSLVGIKMNYQMDRNRFEEAYETGRYLLDHVELIELQELLIRADLVYCELIGEKRKEIVEKLLDGNARRGMKKVSSMLPVQRMWYAYYCLYERDDKKAQEAAEAFEKLARSYPYRAEEQGERELMQIIDETVNGGEKCRNFQSV